MDNHRIFTYTEAFALESGAVLQGFYLAYHTFGQLNAAGDNAVWVFHALTANSDPTAWWPGLVGPGKLLDPADYFIVCVNMPGSCYGSIGPLEVAGEGGLYQDFPLFTIHDMVRAYQPLRDALGIRRIRVGIGGSMGGQQLLEWAVTEPGAFEFIVPIATNAWHSAWGKAFNESQRWCIEADVSWGTRSPEAGMDGMKVARSVALLSYRHYETYALFQSDEGAAGLTGYKAASYQRYQGEKLALRFNAFSYYRLSQSMDSHHVGRHLSMTAVEALRRITARTLVIGLRSDILFPVSEQQYLAAHIPEAKFVEIDSAYGHDGFLLEAEAITREVTAFFGLGPMVRNSNLGVISNL
jgi:homoserine O-acetyltransferase